MSEKEMQELALFRFSLIAPLVNDTFVASSQMQYFRDVSKKSHKLPSGKIMDFSPGTIKKWLISYRKGGIDALIPKTRSDSGAPRVITSETIAKIHAIKEKFPYITGTLLYQKLVEDGYIKTTKTSLSSVLRYLRDNNLKANQLVAVERKAYEMEFAGDCWQSDTSTGPVIKVNGQKRKTYLICVIDDASRLITHGEFFFNDNAVNMQIVFKKAVSKYGKPKRLFVDNGSAYKNDQLTLICASLGVILIHTKAYSPESKGKIERVFRTIKDNWMHGVDWNEFNSLYDLNISFNKYLSEKYLNKEHSSLGMSPRERYLKDSSRINFIPIELIEDHFLHRVTRKVNSDSTIQLHSKFFEVPQKYIGQKINVRYSPASIDVAYIFDKDNSMTDTVYPLKKVDNSKIKRNNLDYTRITGGDNLV